MVFYAQHCGFSNLQEGLILATKESAHGSGEFEASPAATTTEVLALKTQTVVHSSKLLDERHLVDERNTAVIADHFLHSNDCCLMSVIMFSDFMPAGCLETINLVFILNL